MAQLNQLIRSAGYEVRAAFDARQALSLLRIERPDLLLADQDLNDMDGVEMLTRLARQQGGRLAQPSLLLLPREAGEGARREALEIGARAVVSLPYNPEELLDLIRDACGRGVR
jgi:two-component system KDP operon response regulator KdpE